MISAKMWAYIRAFVVASALIMVLFGMFGCVGFQMPTANEIDSMTGKVNPPLRKDAATCGQSYWMRSDAWIAVSGPGVCPDGFPAEQVGYALVPVQGSCEKASYELHGYKPIYGCIKRKINYVDWDNWGK